MESSFYSGLHSLQHLNPIEHLWDHLKRRLGEYEVPPKGILELWEHVEKEWNEIDAQICKGFDREYGPGV